MKYAIGITILLSCFSSSLRAEEKDDFSSLKAKDWQEVFSDKMTGTDWQEKWFLDGIHAKVSNSKEAMQIDTSKGFAVLWTKKEFEGDLRIEYDFKCLDDDNRKGVNIIYIQARGDGQNGCVEDITQWSEKRELAAMKNYFLNMHTYHISYATSKRGDKNNDYVRARRYMPLENKGLSETELKGDYSKVDLFSDREWLRIAIIKKDKKIWMEVKHPKTTKIFKFENVDKPGIEAGRIGLRLMPERLSHFKNFRVYELKK